MKIFAERLKGLRLERALTQTQLAEATGMSQSGIAGYEKGDRMPDLDCVIKLAKFFGCTIDYLVGIEGD